MDTTYCYGQNPRCYESGILKAHDLVMRAWTEKTPSLFNGRYNQQRYCEHPGRAGAGSALYPVWIPGGGSIETWQWCAEMDYVYAYLSYFGTRTAAKPWMVSGEKCSVRQGSQPNRAAFLQFVGVAETRERRWSCIANRRIFYGRCLFTDPMWATPPATSRRARNAPA